MNKLVLCFTACLFSVWSYSVCASYATDLSASFADQADWLSENGINAGDFELYRSKAEHRYGVLYDELCRDAESTESVLSDSQDPDDVAKLKEAKEKCRIAQDSLKQSKENFDVLLKNAVSVIMNSSDGSAVNINAYSVALYMMQQWCEFIDKMASNYKFCDCEDDLDLDS